MYYLTKQDPNYTIKGSRDPLGLQVIWQAAGRKLIPEISTVSISIQDFQILLIAHSLKKILDLNDKEFESFFIRFEQMMAYTRFKINPSKSNGFNGIERIRKIMEFEQPTSLRISDAKLDQILSDQKAYGIWGKYIRPFTDLNFVTTSEFAKIGLKIQRNKHFMHQVRILSKKKNGQVSYIQTRNLDKWSNLLNKPVSSERNMFIEKLLNDTCENELLNLFNTVPDLIDKYTQDKNFYKLIKKLSSASKNSNFKSILSFIYNTEKVISPLNFIFKYLQTKSIWKKSEIDKDVFIKKWKTKIDFIGFDETTHSLAVLHYQTNYELVIGLIKRNEEVSERRNSAPWMQLSDKGIDVNHFDGAFFNKDYNPQSDNDFSYFVNTFISLYKQLN